MPANKLAPLTIGTNRVVWADPLHLSNKFTISMQRSRVKHKAGEANRVSGLYVTNASEQFPQPEGCVDKCSTTGTDDISIRTVIAGSAENLPKLKKIWEAHKANVDAAFASGNAGIGFIDPNLNLVGPDYTTTP